MVYAGLLPWREGKLVERIDSGKVSLESKSFLPYAEQPGRRLARRWVAGEPGSAKDAEFQIRESIKNRPLYAPSWLDLAEVSLKQEKREDAASYVETAAGLWPNRRLLLWEAAMLQIRLGERKKALETLQAYLRSRPSHLQRVAVLAARLEPDPEKMIRAVVPEKPPLDREEDYYLEQFLYYAIQQRNLPLADAVWSGLADETLKNEKIVQNYISFLVKEKERDRAVSAWERAGGGKAMESIVNGGFEEELAQAGFGWIAKDVKGAKWERDNEIAYGGQYSLRVDFDGKENIAYHHLWQLTPVEPGRRYRLRGQWRGAYITTRSNPYFQVFSVGAEKNSSARSESKRLTWDWQPFELELKIPEDAWFLTVRLRRNQTDALDNLISGTVWLDEISLEKVPGDAQ
ncbi:MAG: hypothetical protein U9Q71_08610 [Pseudomonadota bacterium]|nr:hypothetical protein [Pseudomonadota bacterium]